MKKLSFSLRARLKDVRLILFDVDGVLTDGSLLIHPDGSESKTFDVRDGIAIRLALRAGLKVGFLSGRNSVAVAARAKDLGVDVCIQGASDKRQAFEEILMKFGLRAEEVAYVGDDIVDLPVMRLVGFAASVQDASPEAKQAAHYVTRASSGRSAAREIIEIILNAQEKWKKAVHSYTD